MVIFMTIRDIKKLLNADVLACEDMLDKEVHTACGSDMMSDVLAFVKDQAVLLTGLLNPQVVRTAEMMDIICIVFVRGKNPDDAIIELAKEMMAKAKEYADSLIERAADVMLKERRRLIVVVRETPYSLIHLRNMTTLTEAGAIILPASPSFYSHPQSIEELVETIVERIIAHLGIKQRHYEWGK